MRSIASCTFETCPVAASPYGYPPSAAAGFIFVIIHLGSFIACIFYSFSLADKCRWLEFSIPISIACLLESVAYAIRIGSSADPWDVSLYAASTTFIVISPAFISAGIYFTMSQAIKILGPEHSPIHITRYAMLTWIDAIGFVFQFVGLIVAFSDLSPDTGLGHNAHIGSPIIATGTVLQAISLLIYIVLFAIVLFRAAIANSQFGYTTFHPVHGYIPMAHRFKFFLAMMLLSAMCLFARALYQTIILGGGLESWTAKNQALFAGLDSLLVAEAVVGLVVAHPVIFLRDGLEKKLGSRTTSVMTEQQAENQFYPHQSRRYTPSQYSQSQYSVTSPSLPVHPIAVHQIGGGQTPWSSRSHFSLT